MGEFFWLKREQQETYLQLRYLNFISLCFCYSCEVFQFCTVKLRRKHFGSGRLFRISGSLDRGLENPHRNQQIFGSDLFD